jgi:restriction system protein
MAIPKYDEIMLPLLKVLSDGQTHTKRELTEKMADHFGLTPEEREQMAICREASARHSLDYCG